MVRLLIAALFLVSCIETSKQYVLNPDGSGKVTVDIKMTPFTGEGEKSVKNNLKEMLEGSSGVDVWADVSAKSLADGRIQFTGTAYFKNIADLKIKNADDFKITMESVDKTTQRLVVSNKEQSKKMDTKKEDLSVQAQRAKYNQMKPMLSAFLATMKTDVAIELPGTVNRTSNLKKDKKGRLALNFSGDKMLVALDELMGDDAWLAEQVAQGRDIQNSSPAGDLINQKLFGERGPIEALFTPGKKNLFDYAKEVEAARSDYEAMLQRIGLGTLVPVKLATGGQFKNLKVAKVSLSDVDDDDYAHFGTSKRYQLTMLGELPGAVLNITKGELRTAVADNGEDLMPESDWDREINWPQLSDGKNFVMFDLNLKLPSPDVRNLAELTGVIRYVVGSRTKLIQSRVAFNDQAEGEHGVAIEGLEFDGEEYVLKLEITGAGNALKSVRFKDANGREFEAREQSWSRSDDKIWYSYASKNVWPDNGAVVLEVYDDLQEFELPFRVESVDLIGRSIR